MNVLKVSELVREALTHDVDSRDSDAILSYFVWRQQIRKNIFNLPFGDITNMLDEGKLFPVESITRARRKLQRLHLELRGEKYNKRHSHQNNVINQVNQIK